MSEKIIVSFSGWCECDPDKIKFVYIGMYENVKQYITGREWLVLPNYSETETCRDDYILESCADAQVTAIDGSYEDIQVDVEEE